MRCGEELKKLYIMVGRGVNNIFFILSITGFTIELLVSFKLYFNYDLLIAFIYMVFLLPAHKKILAIPLPQRVVLSLMGFLAIVNAYTMRICLSVAITEMVKKIPHNTTDSDEGLYCLADDDENGDSSKGGDFEWSEELQGIILSSFFWGYVITHLPGGVLSEKFGGKYVLSLGILSTALFTLITPLAIDLGEKCILFENFIDLPHIINDCYDFLCS